MKYIDLLLDRITMYRLVVYYLLLLLVAAVVWGYIGVLPYSPSSIILSTGFIVAICWGTNKLFAKAYKAPTNVESVYITALILALIISPARSLSDVPLLFWASIVAIASKFILAINKKHLFNPAAIAVVLTALAFGGSASWWIGTSAMLPFSLLGLLIVRKIQRADLVYYFLLASAVTIFGFTVANGGDLLTTLKQMAFSSPIFFFASIMLTEPLTTPPTKRLQALYGALVGVLFAPQFHVGSFYTTPEQALVIGNLFAYSVSPKYKVVAYLKQKISHGSTMVDFVFPLHKKLVFQPGQYMEWTLPHPHTDSRGNRRFFTIASSPTESNLMLGVKFYPNGSSYKKALASLDGKTPVIGAQPGGDFTLPENPHTPLVFIAGGIGITPFRSMIKYLIDINQPRPITLLYSANSVDDIAYADVFAEAQQKLGIRVFYTLTDTAKVPPHWTGLTGRITDKTLASNVPNFRECVYYLSGPHAMVVTYKELLRSIGIRHTQIKSDFFPGFA